MSADPATRAAFDPAGTGSLPLRIPEPGSKGGPDSTDRPASRLPARWPPSTRLDATTVRAAAVGVASDGTAMPGMSTDLTGSTSVAWDDVDSCTAGSGLGGELGFGAVFEGGGEGMAGVWGAEGGGVD